VRKAITSADENKMLSSFVVRFCFHRRPCATPPLPSSVPRQAFRCAPLARLQTSVSGSKASRFRRPFSFAPLLGRPPGGSLVGALKRIVFRPLIVATSPRDGHTGACLFGCAAAKGTPAAA